MARCVSFTLPAQSAEWLEFSDCTKAIILHITEVSEDILPCIRHLYEFPYFLHEVVICAPPELAHQPWMSPWLSAKPRLRKKQEAYEACWHVQTPKYHISDKSPAPHYASFDLRVNGHMTRILFDTGATVSIVSDTFIRALDLPFDRTNTTVLDGIGGQAATLGTVDLQIKIKSRMLPATCHVVHKFNPCYQVLLGQDWLRHQNWGIKFGDTEVRFSFGLDENEVFLSRPYKDDVRLASGPHAYTLHSVFNIQPVTHDDCPGNVPRRKARPEPSSKRASFMVDTRKAYQDLKRDIRSGCVSYHIFVANEVDTDAPTDKDNPLIKLVLDKHSAPGQTLNGDVPPGTTAEGAECYIRIERDARPVARRQFRLTPQETAILQEKIADFIARGWIEPSNSPWSSSVLFVPKPNGDLRFCVDFRFLNKVTVKDKNPLPTISALLDMMVGCTHFSALDLLSGFYQLNLASECRDYTAFPTPWGQYRWKVMPMGLANAPGVFQQAMNQVLSEHIRAGYCLVYLDDVLIKSTSLEEHARHLDAVLTSLGASKFFCQLPKCQFRAPATNVPRVFSGWRGRPARPEKGRHTHVLGTAAEIRSAALRSFNVFRTERRPRKPLPKRSVAS